MAAIITITILEMATGTMGIIIIIILEEVEMVAVASHGGVAIAPVMVPTTTTAVSSGEDQGTIRIQRITIQEVQEVVSVGDHSWLHGFWLLHMF